MPPNPNPEPYPFPLPAPLPPLQHPLRHLERDDMLAVLASGALPDDRHPLLHLERGDMLAVLASGAVPINWPSNTHPVIKRLCTTCLAARPDRRPTAHVVSKVRAAV
eukprot:41853-Chlamydomonas_euryale.AAC.1